MDFAILQIIRVLGVTVASFLIAISITPAITSILQRYKFTKQIRSRESAPIFSHMHENKQGTPTGGGVIIWGTTLGLAAILWVLSAIFDTTFSYLDFFDRKETYLPIAAMIIAAIIGLIDDILGMRGIGPKGGGLRVRDKLIIYVIISITGALWFYYRLDWDVIRIPLLGTFQLGLPYIPFFMFIITASAFSVNETDGLDGLAGGVLLFAFSALTVVAFVLGRFHLAVLSGSIIGGLLAFLWYNIHPAKFFMGDTGSMSLGITLGTIAMVTNTAFLLPFFAFVPMMESISVIIQMTSKLIRGKKVFLSTPIHHHFEATGWKESQIVMRFWIISVIFTGLGLVIFFLDKFLFL